MSLAIQINVKARVYVPKSGTGGNQLMVDSKQVSTVEDGNYLYAGILGSGRHTFVRTAN
jgi:hypothetical protein